MSAKRRRERARKLKMFARLIDQEAADLETSVTKCECCGLNVSEDYDEHRWGMSIAAVTKKLRRIADDMESAEDWPEERSGATHEAADEPQEA